uniref:Corticotropin-releasing factor domain-containing protein n=1 Tax=Anolis carolinensis TaxID=28377 RepID=A0A803T1R7_ANOCA
LRMVPAASFLLLLFLPLKSCLPLEWPSWELCPSKDRLPPKACKLPGGEPAPKQQRTQRSPSSSKRRDGRPNSLDLTFHLLREFLEMSREERLAQKARSNKILLHNIGK